MVYNKLLMFKRIVFRTEKKPLPNYSDDNKSMSKEWPIFQLPLQTILYLSFVQF